MTPQKLLCRPLTTQKCTVGCPILDRCLGGGIPCNSITELVAESGSGKTQFCLQLCLHAQLPSTHGGLSASSIYLYTEFPFPIRRLHQLSTVFRSVNSNIDDDPKDRIYVQSVNSVHQLLGLMPRIEYFLKYSKSRFPIRVIVIDSIAALFRSEFENNSSDLMKRSSLFFKISAKLKAMALGYNLAVVVTNQVVDMVDPHEGINGLRIGNMGFLYTSGRRVYAALGLGWANCVNSRLFLSRNEEEFVSDENQKVAGSSCDDGGGIGGDFWCRRMRRRLHVLFAPHLPASSCEFEITRDGVSGFER